MCFSATASFVSGTVLVATGTYYLQQQKVFTKPFSHTGYLGLIPLLFGVQQLLEGLVWTGVAGQLPATLMMAAAYLFSFMATSLWPAWIPFAMYRFEQNKPRFLPLVVVGVLVGLFLLWSSTWHSPLQVKVLCNQRDCHSLAYLFAVPWFTNSINFIYLFLVVTPFFLSHNKRIRFGVAPAFLFSFVLGALLSKGETFPSVWCFFAALMSASIFLVSLKPSQGKIPIK